MRDRDGESSNPPPKPPTPPLPGPTGPEDDGFVYHLTLKARRLPAEGARRVSGGVERRRLRVCGRYRSDEVRVPDLRMSGLWLATAGFDLGQRYEVEVRHGELTIRPV